MRPTRSMQGNPVSQGTGIIERPRLLQRLEGAFNHRLTLITAPPGFGKTTLVAQLTRRAQAQVAWQTIDERSRDLPNLYSQAIDALSAVTPDITHLAPPYGYGPGELATLIGDHLAEHLTGDLIYVLDDVHQLTGAAPAEAWLRGLVTALPPSCHLILASRTLPRLPLVEMIARGDVLAVGLDELRFTPAEIGDLGTTLNGLRPSDDQVQELASRLEGWPVGTALAFQPLPPELEQMALSGQDRPEALFDGMARIMLQAQTPSIRNFLLASSTVNRLTPEVCADALELSGSAQMLMEIQSRNLFVSRVPGALVYHTLFRNFLQEELKQADADWFRELHGMAARWYEANDQPDEAFDHYVAAELPESAAMLAEHLAAAYHAQNRVETLLMWNNLLRQSATASPRLAFRCAMLYIARYDYDAAEERLRETEATRPPDQEETSPAAILIQYGHIHIMRGNGQAAIDCVAELADTDEEPTNVRGRALNILGRAALLLGHTEDAIDHLEAALPLYRSYADNYAQAQLLQNIVTVYWRIGRLNDALAALHEVVALQRSLGGAGPLALALNSLGYAYHQLGDYPHSVSALQEGLSAIARFPNPRAEGYLTYNLADVKRDQGDLKDALDLYNRALDIVGDSEPSLTCSILCGISTLYRWQEQIPDATAAAQEAMRLARKQNIGTEGREARLLLWAARVHEGDSAKALSELEQVAGEFEDRQERFDLLLALGLCADAALCAGNAAAAAKYLDRAAQLGTELGTSAPLGIEILRLPALEELMRQKERKYVTLLNSVEQLRALQPQPDEQPETADERMSDVIYSLRIVTLGQSLVIRDGKAIPNTAWRPAARDMFLYLVFTKQASRDDVCLAFWPDSPAKKARDNFHATMHRIREVLGENTVILHDDNTYQINPAISIWCDAYELESLAAQARILPFADARTEDLWQRCVGLYNGDFLPSLDFEWAVDYREQLHEIYVEALIGLGRSVQARGDTRQAIETYKRALSAEPYREDVHLAIMSCHIAKGAKHKALAQLNQLKQLLRKDLGVGPSKETLQMANALLA